MRNSQKLSAMAMMTAILWTGISEAEGVGDLATSPLSSLDSIVDGVVSAVDSAVQGVVSTSGLDAVTDGHLFAVVGDEVSELEVETSHGEGIEDTVLDAIGSTNESLAAVVSEAVSESEVSSVSVLVANLNAAVTGNSIHLEAADYAKSVSAFSNTLSNVGNNMTGLVVLGQNTGQAALIQQSISYGSR